MRDSEKFWEHKNLRQLSLEEWENLCDRCGLCCLHTLQDEDTELFYRTGVACNLFDAGTCSCKSYSQRRKYIKDCVQLTPDIAETAAWLPPTCAYRLVREGRPLPPWHHLNSGSFDTVHEQGKSARGKVKILEEKITCAEDMINYLLKEEPF